MTTNSSDKPKWGADAARQYDKAVGRASRVAAAVLIDRANDILPLSSANILEFGAGTGSTTHLLAERYPDTPILATDISGAMLDILRSKSTTGNIKTRVLDMRSIPLGEEGYERGQYTHIFSTMAIANLVKPDETLAQWKSLVRPGGLIAIASWDLGQPFAPFEVWSRSVKAVDPTYEPAPLVRPDKTPQTLDQIIDALRRANLEIVSSESVPLSMFDGQASFEDFWWKSRNPFTIRYMGPFKGDLQAVRQAMKKVLREDYDEERTLPLHGAIVVARKALYLHT